MTLSAYQKHILISVLEGDRSFQLYGYNLLRADYPSNTKQGGVCIYYKESLCLGSETIKPKSMYHLWSFPKKL